MSEYNTYERMNAAGSELHQAVCSQDALFNVNWDYECTNQKLSLMITLEEKKNRRTKEETEILEMLKKDPKVLKRQAEWAAQRNVGQML